MKKGTGPKALTGSRDAKRMAAVLLQVLSGECGPQEGGAALGISLSRYYVLETRALQGMITALEPLPKGRQRRVEDLLAQAERDKKRLEQELARSQALLRASHRSIGLASKKAPRRGKVGATGQRKRRHRIVRARKAIASLQADAGAGSSAEPTS